MFIAMNRFRVAKGSESAFEPVWLSRDGHLDEVPGFVGTRRPGSDDQAILKKA
jgi:heme-degrading monooxygenase HmoA